MQTVCAENIHSIFLSLDIYVLKAVSLQRWILLRLANSVHLIICIPQIPPPCSPICNNPDSPSRAQTQEHSMCVVSLSWCHGGCGIAAVRRTNSNETRALGQRKCIAKGKNMTDFKFNPNNPVYISDVSGNCFCAGKTTRKEAYQVYAFTYNGCITPSHT